MGKNINQIATMEDCNSITSGTYVGNLKRCPKYEELISDFTVSGIYAVKQLVKYSDISSNRTTLTLTMGSEYSKARIYGKVMCLTKNITVNVDMNNYENGKNQVDIYDFDNGDTVTFSLTAVYSDSGDLHWGTGNYETKPASWVSGGTINNRLTIIYFKVVSGIWGQI